MRLAVIKKKNTTTGENAPLVYCANTFSLGVEAINGADGKQSAARDHSVRSIHVKRAWKTQRCRRSGWLMWNDPDTLFVYMS